MKMESLVEIIKQERLDLMLDQYKTHLFEKKVERLTAKKSSYTRYTSDEPWGSNDCSRGSVNGGNRDVDPSHVNKCSEYKTGKGNNKEENNSTHNSSKSERCVDRADADKSTPDRNIADKSGQDRNNTDSSIIHKYQEETSQFYKRNAENIDTEKNKDCKHISERSFIDKNDVCNNVVDSSVIHKIRAHTSELYTKNIDKIDSVKSKDYKHSLDRNFVDKNSVFRNNEDSSASYIQQEDKRRIYEKGVTRTNTYLGTLHSLKSKVYTRHVDKIDADKMRDKKIEADNIDVGKNSTDNKYTKRGSTEELKENRIHQAVINQNMHANVTVSNLKNDSDMTNTLINVKTLENACEDKDEVLVFITSVFDIISQRNSTIDSESSKQRVNSSIRSCSSSTTPEAYDYADGNSDVGNSENNGPCSADSGIDVQFDLPHRFSFMMAATSTL